MSIDVDTLIEAANRAPNVIGLKDASGNVLAGRPVTWSTASQAVATVSAAGVVTGVAAGTTTVRATSGTAFDEAIVRVTSIVTPTGGITWTRGSGGLWSDPANWTPARVPQPGDTVFLTQGVAIGASATGGCH